MINLYIDPTTRDLAIDNFNLKLTEDSVSWVAQTIENRLRTFKGEWFLNRNLGIPYFDTVLVKNPDIDQINSLFLTQITSISELEEVLEFETTFNTDTRKLQVTFAVQASGEEVSGEVSL